MPPSTSQPSATAAPVDPDQGAGAAVISTDPTQQFADYFDAMSAADVAEIQLALYAVNPDKRTEKSYLTHFPASDIDPFALLESILAEYGPGEYVLQSKRNTRFDKEWRFRVGRAGHSANSDSPLLRRLQSAAPSAAPSRPMGSADASASPAAPDDKLTAMIEQNNELLRTLIERDQAPAPAGTLGMVKELGAVIAIVRELMPQQQPAAADGMQEMFKLMRSVLRLKDEMAGDGGGDMVGAAVRQLLPLLGDAVQKLDQQPPRRRPAPGGEQIPSPPRTPAPSVSTEPAPPDNVVRAFRLFAPYVPTLVSHAAAGTDVDQVAAMICSQLDVLSDEHFEDAAAFLCDTRALNYMAGVDAGVVQYEQWFRELITAVQHSAIDDGDGDPGSFRELVTTGGDPGAGDNDGVAVETADDAPDTSQAPSG